jgi:hypothetical protein
MCVSDFTGGAGPGLNPDLRLASELIEAPG